MNKKEMANHINEKLSNLLFSLYERWQDEREHEDFNDYIKAFTERIPGTLRGLKKPFGFIIKCTDGNLQVSVKVQGKFLKLFYADAK